MKVQVAPSILSADFSNLAADIKKVERAGADMLHIDVMDGHFVPNITIGPAVVKSIRKVTKLPLDVHLMIKNPADFLPAFVEAGSDMITMHIETIDAKSFAACAKFLNKKRVRPGVSLNPKTTIARLKPFLNAADFVLVMSVNPGFSGQGFMPVAIGKIKQLRSIFARDIAVDGGINDKTAKLVIDAGANIIAAGSFIFGSSNILTAIERIRNAAKF